MRILALDPGSKNLGFSVWDELKTKLKFVAADNFRFPIQKMDKIHFRAFRADLRCLIEVYAPDIILIENFTSRPRKGTGNVAVKIGAMVFAVWSVCEDIEFETIYPFTWKPKIKELHPGFQKYYKKKYNLKNKHQADSAGIAEYWYLKNRKGKE